jgi:hypothetical protein
MRDTACIIIFLYINNIFAKFDILTLEHRLRVFENRVLRRIFGPKRDKVTGEWRSWTMMSFIFCTHPQIVLGTSNQGE